MWLPTPLPQTGLGLQERDDGEYPALGDEIEAMLGSVPDLRGAVAEYDAEALALSS